MSMKRFLQLRMIILSMAMSLQVTMFGYNEGDVFKARTAEGIEMTFLVIHDSEEFPEVQVGTGKCFTDNGLIYKPIDAPDHGTPYFCEFPFIPAIDPLATGNVTIPVEVEGFHVTEIAEGAFYNCSKVTGISIPEQVERIGCWAFWDCQSLTSISLPAQLREINAGLFAGCESLKTVIMNSDMRLSEISDYAFYNCKNLKSLDIPQKTFRIGQYVFHGCSNLKSITIPDSDGADGTALNTGLFVGCTSLESVKLPGKADIGDYLFYGCKNLKSVDMPESISTIGMESFSGCSNLEAIHLADDITRIREGAFVGCTNLKSITLPSSLVQIGEGAFSGCTSLNTIVIPRSVESISWSRYSYSSYSGEDCNSAFTNCPNLVSIKVEDGNHFYDSRENCNAIIDKETNRLIVGCQNTIIPSTAETINNWAFKGCSGLKLVVIPNNIKEIDDEAFRGCDMLTTLDINCTTVGKWLNNISPLEKVIIRDKVEKIEYLPFMGCSNLSQIVVDNANKLYDSRNDCNAIIETASNKLVVGCKTSVISNGVEAIGDWAFNGCIGLTSITIPSSVSEFGLVAFQRCPDLREVISHVVNPFSFTYYTFESETYYDGILYVPIGTLERYKNTEGWKSFKNIVEGNPSNVETISSETIEPHGIYSVNGISFAKLQRGINIIRYTNGRIKKLLVK